MPKATLHGVDINYRQSGDGRDLVLLHGLAANHAFWNPQMLALLAGRYRVTTVDLRGHGYSAMPPSGYTPADLAGDLDGLLDHLDIPRAHLMGHSFGGAVALLFSTIRPQRAASLILADTRIRALQPAQRLRDWPDWQEAKKLLEAYGVCIDDDEDEVGFKLLEKAADPRWIEARQRLGQNDSFVPFCGWSAGKRSAQRWLQLLRTTTARHDFVDPGGLTREMIAGLALPVLAVYGQHSRCMTTCRQLAEILPRCRTAIIPGAGHFFPVSRPRLLARHVLRFLVELDEPGASLDGDLAIDDAEEPAASRQAHRPAGPPGGEFPVL